MKPSQVQNGRDAGAGKGSGPLKGLGLGALRPDDRQGRGPLIVGSVLSAIWLLLILVDVLITPAPSEAPILGVVITLLIVLMPIGLISMRPSLVE